MRYIEGRKGNSDVPEAARRHEPGFSLVELLITLAVAGIFLAIAVPSFRDVVQNTRVSSTSSDFFTTMAYARSEAIKRGTAVSVCKSADGATCGGSGSFWSNGWIVFENTDGDNPAAVDSGEEVLRVFGALPGNYSIHGSSNLASFLTYDRYGMAHDLGTFVVCANSDETRAKGIVVIRTRLRMATDTDGDGIPNKEENGSIAGNITSCESP